MTFDGDAFAEEYMLADVEVDWDLPTGYRVRAISYGIGDVAACAHLVRPDGYLAFGISRPAVDNRQSASSITDGAPCAGSSHRLPARDYRFGRGRSAIVGRARGPRCRRFALA